MQINKSLAKDVLAGRFEQMGDGKIFVPGARIVIGGVFSHELIRAGRSLGVMHDHNLVVNQGLMHVLSTTFNGGAIINPWYIALFEGNYTPVATDTAANIVANSTESVAYNEATRPEYVEAAPSGQSITNSANKATFTMNATKTIYGASMLSASAKSAVTGTLLASSRFSAARNVVAADQLLVTYTFTAADA